MLRQMLVSAKGERLWQGIPGIERAANGRLWVTFFSGGFQEPHEDNFILLATSTDDGATWSKPRIVIERPGKTRVFDPCLWHDPAGRLWLFFNQANLEEGEHSLWAMTCDDASGGTLRWSAPRRIEVDAPYAFRLNKPTVLSSGRWLLPVTFARDLPGKWFHKEHVQGLAVSDDQGGTWRFRGALEAPKWALENMTIERRNGSVWMLIRTGGGVLWQSASGDGGETWSAAEPSTIVNPGSRFFIRRLRSGRLLLINTPDPKERTTLFAYLSDDDGRTFSGGLQLDDRPKVSYPDAVEAPDGVIHAVHDHDRYGPGEIIYSSFREADMVG